MLARRQSFDVIVFSVKIKGLSVCPECRRKNKNNQCRKYYKENKHFIISLVEIIAKKKRHVNKKAPRRVLFYISSFGGTSMLSETYFPFFLRCLTHSVSRYSICPFTERKSSSAQEAMSLYSFSERRKGICFFSAISVQTTRIYHGLCVAVTAENYQEI